MTFPRETNPKRQRGRTDAMASLTRRVSMSADIGNLLRPRFKCWSETLPITWNLPIWDH